MKTKLAALMASVLAILILPACGGGGGGGSGSSNETANGLWSGTATEEGVTHQVAGLAYNGYIIMISDQGLIYEGSYSVDGSSFRGSVDMFDGTYVGTANLSGTVASHRSISGSFQTSYGSSGTVSLGYEAIYERDVTTADLSGQWASYSGGVATTINFNTDATLSGYDNTGCLYEGTAQVIEPGRNLFRLNVEATHCGDTSINGNFSGYAALLDVSTRNDTLQYTLRNDFYIIVNYLER